MNKPQFATQYLVECDARVIVAVPNVTIFRERFYPRYRIEPCEPKNRAKLEEISVEVTTTELSDPIVIHSPFLF